MHASKSMCMCYISVHVPEYISAWKLCIWMHMYICVHMYSNVMYMLTFMQVSTWACGGLQRERWGGERENQSRILHEEFEPKYCQLHDKPLESRYQCMDHVLQHLKHLRTIK